ncbi:MAG: sugar phosphorylase [Roseiflexaceae bacterium]|nr:sugar phosphorylase [Roseiflexaceae bacterium]
MPTTHDIIHGHLAFLYGTARADALAVQLQARLAAFRAAHPELGRVGSQQQRLSEDDVILITYGDQVQEPGVAPLRTLGEVMATTLGDVVSGVHLLPFYPYTSDDGFSVVDYRAVDPALGVWADLAPLRARYKLMYDAVVNHISASSAWFKAYLLGDPAVRDYFIALDPHTDVSQVTRPRTHPLLSKFDTADGEKWLWTTFSVDQIDLNVAHPEVLLELIDVLLLYVAEGASLLRLDAIGYLWKELGTRCIHLPQTHRAVQLFRSVLDEVAPNVLLVTETNVPHADNISYFGDGTNEAQMVYQFPLSPLVLNALHTGSGRHLSEWAGTLAPPSAQTTFFNFLASHDGIGVVPATGILSPQEVGALAEQVLAHGGRVSYKNNPDGSQSPYELNITLFDALSDPHAADEFAVDRFICAHAIMLALQGVPGIYIHSLVGSHNNLVGLAATGRARTINREKWQRAELEARLADPGTHERQVFAAMSALIRARRAAAALHPSGAQQVLDLGEAFFALLRTAPGGGERMVCVHNLSSDDQPVPPGLGLGLPNSIPAYGFVWQNV